MRLREKAGGLATAVVRGAEIRDARRIVVKLGTNVVLDAGGSAATDRLARIVASLVALRAAGRDVLLVTSGAVALGATRLGGPAEGSRQACAAVGQGRLLAFYHDAFARSGVEIAQLLLTDEDFRSTARARRLSTTLDALLSMGVLPVINENDAVAAGDSAASRAPTFRDNDMLAALVARAVGASLLVLLSDVNGVYTRDPETDDGAALIPTLRRVTPAVLDGAAGCSTRGRSTRGRGGMAAKLRAADRASAAGIDVVIANGHAERVIARILDGEAVGTLLT
ncbi:MAG: glutamate 5-kinase, partial [Gemmatirosa sp.]